MNNFLVICYKFILEFYVSSYFSKFSLILGADRFLNFVANLLISNGPSLWHLPLVLISQIKSEIKQIIH